MAILKSLAEMIVPPLPQTKNAWLAAYGANDQLSQARAFQYFPEQLTDNRSVSIEEKYGIGSSHPIYQWIRGSAREITFDAVFTSEDAGLASSSVEDTVNQIKGWVKNPAMAAVTAISGKAAVDKKHNQNIPAAINWLRSFTYPIYDSSRRVTAPPKCALWFEGSGIGSFVQGVGSADVIPCLMTRCDVNYEAFFNNGTPRVATVSLQFVEIVQVGKNWSYVNGLDVQTAGAAYTGPVDSKQVQILQKSAKANVQARAFNIPNISNKA